MIKVWSIALVLAVMPSQVGAKRPFTVPDAITLTEFVPTEQAPDGLYPSPSRNEALALVRRGDLKSNTNIYQLVLAKADGREGSAKVVATFISSSNRPAIDQVRWLDPDQVTFLGEQPGGLPQVKLLNVRTGRVRTLTNERLVIGNYAIRRPGGPLLLDVESPPDVRKKMAQGYVVGDTRFYSVLHPDGRGAPYSDRALYILRNGKRTKVRLDDIERTLWTPWPTASISPDGRYAVIALKRSNYPRSWWIDIPAAKDMPGSSVFGPGGDDAGSGDDPAAMLQFHLVDLASGSIRPLLNAPTTFGLIGSAIGAAWSEDSRQVLLANTFDTAHALGAFIVSVDAATRAKRLALFSDDEADTFRSAVWSRGAITLSFAEGAAVSKRAYTYAASGWRQTSLAKLKPSFADDETRDRPPELALLRSDGTRKILTSFNTALGNVQLTPVKPITWQDSKGRKLRGGLLLPNDYIPGKRIPIVIYTHGDGHEYFWSDGPYHGMGYSDRATAAQGIGVVEIYEPIVDFSTPGEIEAAVDRYAALVAELDKQGIVDTTRIGIHAWSRTGLYLLDALLDCRVHYVAASASDADILSRQELTDGFMITAPAGMRDTEGLIGAKFWADGAKIWNSREPMSRLSEVSAPLRLESSGWRPAWWDAYVILRRFRRPVEYVSYPGALHSPVRPLERLTSQQGSVDWYVFWLLERESSDPQKQEQYRRWRKLRSQRSDPTISTCASHNLPESSR